MWRGAKMRTDQKNVLKFQRLNINIPRCWSGNALVEISPLSVLIGLVYATWMGTLKYTHIPDVDRQALHCDLNVSQCSLQRPSVLRMNAMDSSTEGRQDNLWVLGNARDSYSACIRQTVTYKRQQCQNILCFITCSIWALTCFLGRGTTCLDELQNCPFFL